MAEFKHQWFWSAVIAEKVKAAGGDESESLSMLQTAAAQVDALLEHPGWQFMAEVIGQARDVQAAMMVRSHPLPQDRYIAVSRAVMAYEQVLELGPVLLDIVAAEQQRQEAILRAREAASGSGEA